jgi:hypothetical protein
MSCPHGAGPVRLLFDSEDGTPAAKVDAGSTWVRAPDTGVFPAVPANATSGRGSWFSNEPIDITQSSLVLHPVALPARRPAYLWFQQWRLLESDRNFQGRIHNFDGGTVEVSDTTRGGNAKPAESLRWVNGPEDKLNGTYGNPAAGRLSFSRDSRGYVASRAALTRYAGHATSPRFTMNTDNNSTEIGWYLDDVRVYTCGRGPMPRTTPRISGTASVGSTLTAHPGRWTSHAERTVQWYAGGSPIAGARGRSYQVRSADVGTRITVKVVATAGGRHTTVFSPATPKVS